MESPFNPYHAWLDLPATLVAPDHYQLLGLPSFESDGSKIAEAAERAMSKARKCRPGAHAARWAALLDELQVVKQKLTNASTKGAYDTALRSGANSEGAALNFVPASTPDWLLPPSAKTEEATHLNPTPPSAPSTPAHVVSPVPAAIAPLPTQDLLPPTPLAAAPVASSIVSNIASPAPITAPVSAWGSFAPPGAAANTPANIPVAGAPQPAPYPHAPAGMPMAQPFLTQPGYFPQANPQQPPSMMPYAGMMPPGSALPQMGMPQPTMPPPGMMMPYPVAMQQPIMPSPYSAWAAGQMGGVGYSAPGAIPPPFAPSESPPVIASYAHPPEPAYAFGSPQHEYPPNEPEPLPVGKIVSPDAADSELIATRAAPGVRSPALPASRRKIDSTMLALTGAVVVLLIVIVGVVASNWNSNPGDAGAIASKNPSDENASDAAVAEKHVTLPPVAIPPAKTHPTSETKSPNSGKTLPPKNDKSPPKNPGPQSPPEESMPAPVNEPDPTKMVGEPKPEPKTEPKPEPKTEPKPEPKPEMKPEEKPEPKPIAKPEEKPETSMEPLKPQELAALGEAMRQTRAALAERNIAAAKTELAKAKTLARSPEQKEMVERLSSITNYVGQYWNAVREAVRKAMGELEIGATRVAVVESDEAGGEWITIRNRGQNQRYTLATLPAGISKALALNFFDNKDSATKVIIGSYLAVEPKAQPGSAKQHWEEAMLAGADIAYLMPFLLDQYDLEKAAAKTNTTAAKTAP